MPVEQTVDERQAPYLAAFEERDGAAPGGEWLAVIRRAAIQNFAALGFPTTHDENWKFTSVAPLVKLSFNAPAADDRAHSDDVNPLAERLVRKQDCLVFINGRYAAGLSHIAANSKVRMLSMRDALASDSNLLKTHLARYADDRHQAFVAWNTAFLDDGAVVEIPDRAAPERPVHLLYISTPGERPQITHPRNLIVGGSGSRFSLIETYIGSGGNAAARSPYFTNAVTEIVCGEDAIVDHYKLQQEAGSAFHIATLQVEQGRGSNFRSHSISFGGALTRNDVNSVLSEGSECSLIGLYAVDGRQHVDTHTAIDHAKPHAASHELYKGILDGQAGAVFNGKIIVRMDAQKTDARQTNRNLVLSDGATINTKPELQIYADDVRCTHGATVGQLDEEAIFYLRSRGIGRESAREILTHAFAAEVTSTIRVESLRNYVEELLALRLAKEAK